MSAIPQELFVNDSYTQNESPFFTCTCVDPRFSAFHDARMGIEWMYMRDADRPCFTPELMRVMQAHYDEIAEQQSREIRYTVLSSEIPGIFNLGGDLAKFRHYIETHNRDALMRYARACVVGQFSMLTSFGRDITHIALVQGDALGGGFECALAADVLIAERGTQMGFPEILFNLFPGMGAYSILSRKVGDALAHRLISEGNLYKAEDLHEMGVVDHLSEPGEGMAAVLDYVKHEDRVPNGIRAIRKARDIAHPITFKELMDITEVWVDAALRLRPRDLRMMQRLVKRQANAVSERST